MPKTKELIYYHKDGSIYGKGKKLGEKGIYWEWFRKNS